MFHVEAGARTFIDFAKRMINDLGDAIRPYLKAIYNGAKDMPGMEELRKTMTSYEGVMNIDVNGIAAEEVTEAATQSRQTEPAEQAEPAEQIEETVVRKEEDADKYRAFSQSVADDMLEAMETGEKPYKSIVAIRAKAKSVGLDIDEGGRDDILLQELVEDGLVSAARQYVNRYIISAMLRGEKADDVRKSRELFNEVVRLYSLQPTISQRSTNRIRMQQYSTPLPMSFAADMFVFRERMRDVLEPTAGNGMLVFAIPEGTVHANELDKTRLDNLRAQKFKRVTDQDAMQPFEGDQQYDAVITNPPFGNAEAKEYDGKMIPGLAPQIALNALSKMKDNGKAVIIVGGNMTYGKNGGLVGDKQFFTYLYDHYNVKGVIDMDGKLYQKQGNTYPTRMILIDGRRSEADRELSKVYPPVQSEALPKAETFDDLYRIVTEVINSNKKTNGNEVLRAAGGPERIDGKPKSRQTDLFDNPGQSDANDTNGRDRGTRTPVRGRSNSGNRGNGQDAVSSTSEQGGASLPELGVPEVPGGTGNQGRGGTSSDNGIVPAGRQSESNGETGRGVANGGTGRVQLDRAGGTVVVGQSAPRVEQKPKEQRKLNQEKLSYRTHNTAFSLESVAPAAMVESMDASLSEIEKEVGSIDEFVRSELGYDTIEEAHNALAAEQMDSVAMAIYQMKKGNAMIIGDQTGVGKGRQMAALIRWAVKQGKKPVFITKDANLFSDIYRDLVDIGSGDLRPFIFNSATGDNPGVMTDKDGNVIYRALDKAAQNKVLAGDKLPDDYDYAVLSYSQVNTGDAKSREEARQIAKKNGGRAKKKDTGKERPTPKADFLRKIAKDNIMLLDESHSAAGESNTGAYLQSLVKDAKAVTFASATFAKRPDTMPLYAIRTAMSEANVKPDELIAIIEKGGVTLQEIMSRALSESGQMVRRERDMSDVKTDWTTVDDEATVKRARENYDRTIEAFNAIIQFQKQFVEPKIAELDAELGWMASSADVKKGTKNAGVDNPPFVNKTFNYTKQLLLALKVDAIVDQVEAEI
ncbi:MAG: strawberry notch family protein, partial [Victivallales bacterium]|nr:strawberry notch family protein [Victivallales bacterium]